MRFGYFYALLDRVPCLSDFNQRDGAAQISNFVESGRGSGIEFYRYYPVLVHQRPCGQLVERQNFTARVEIRYFRDVCYAGGGATRSKRLLPFRSAAQAFSISGDKRNGD